MTLLKMVTYDVDRVRTEFGSGLMTEQADGATIVLAITKQ